MRKINYWSILLLGSVLSACGYNDEAASLNQNSGNTLKQTPKNVQDKRITLDASKKHSARVREEDVIWDPFEPWNRGVFIFNQGVEHVLWEPLITVYKYIMPSIGQTGVHNFLENIKAPTSIASSALQGDGEKTLLHCSRFICNTVFGLGGLVDIATDINIVVEPEDLGKAMKAYNVPPGWFVMIPFLGPTVSRDGIGKILSTVVYAAASPALLASYGAFGAENLNQRLIFKDSIDHVLEFSADPYAVIRRAYYESRGELPDESEDEDLDDIDDGDE